MQLIRGVWAVAVALCWVVLVAACGVDGVVGTTTTVPGGEGTTVVTTPDRGDRTPSSLPERVPSEVTTFPPVTGEVPSGLLEPVVADAARRAGVGPGEVVVVTAQEMVWSDGSLGCAEPGEVYTQAEVPGYWVVLEAGGAAFDYRLAASGFFKLCTSPGLRGTSPTS